MTAPPAATAPRRSVIAKPCAKRMDASLRIMAVLRPHSKAGNRAAARLGNGRCAIGDAQARQLLRVSKSPDYSTPLAWKAALAAGVARNFTNAAAPSRLAGAAEGAAA
jgi:hypothetical protein